MNDYMIFYLGAMNVVLFLLMWHDKKQAKKEAARVPEKHLFLLACLGGALGGIFGMYHYRHKTRKAKFRIGFPILLVFQVILLYPMMMFAPLEWLVAVSSFLLK